MFYDRVATRALQAFSTTSARRRIRFSTTSCLASSAPRFVAPFAAGCRATAAAARRKHLPRPPSRHRPARDPTSSSTVGPATPTRLPATARPKLNGHKERFIFYFIFYRAALCDGVFAMVLCPSVSVCLSQVGVLLKRLNMGSHKQHHSPHDSRGTLVF